MLENENNSWMLYVKPSFAEFLMKKNTNSSQVVTKILDIIPLVIFFITYKIYDLITATVAIIASTIFVAGFLYIKYKEKPSKMTIVTTLIMLIMGGISIYADDSRFIKMKPTVLYFIFAITLIVGIVFDKFFIKLVLGQILNLPKKRWISISWQWIFFFITLSAINEVVWRLFSEQIWVYFKVAAIPIISFVFLGMQIYCNKDGIKKDYL